MHRRHAHPAPRPAAYHDAVSRLAAARHQLRLADPHGGGPASDLDSRNGAILGAAIAGLDALAAVREQAPAAEASLEMVDQIRRELAEISGLVIG